MIYRIVANFSNAERIYYASSFGNGYEMFKKVGYQLTFATFFIKHIMYERKKSNVRHGLFFCTLDNTEEIA